MAKERSLKAAGTYGLLDVLRHPGRILGSGSEFAGGSDIEAIGQGGGRIVSCFLRGPCDPYPRRLKQGRLTLSGSEATWTPSWSLRRRPLALDATISAIETRPADQREPNVKKGGRAFGAVVIPHWVVVTCSTPSGEMDIVVPSADDRLIAEFFRKRIT